VPCNSTLTITAENLYPYTYPKASDAWLYARGYTSTGEGASLFDGVFTIYETYTPPVVVSTAGIFFPLDEQGETTASDLTASVGTATSTTVGGLTPIVVVVMGVLLAFIAIKTVISLVYETKQSKK